MKLTSEALYFIFSLCGIGKLAPLCFNLLLPAKQRFLQRLCRFDLRLALF